jgi:hypothetical protein
MVVLTSCVFVICVCVNYCNMYCTYIFCVLFVYFYCFVCTNVGLLPLGESPIAVNNNNNSSKYLYKVSLGGSGFEH